MAVTLIACIFIVIRAQETKKASSQDRPVAGLLELTPPHFTFGQSQTSNPMIPARQSTTRGDNPTNTHGSPFVVRNGAVYMKVLNGQLFPVPGGGASGCFSLDLPRRITNLQEFRPRLIAPEPPGVKPN